MSQTSPDAEPGVRLQKVLAAAGIGSRRHSEELIARGRVRVNGKVVRTQGVRVDPEQDVVEVDGERIVTRSGLVYLAANKPRGMLSAMSDDRGRPTLADLVDDRSERLFHVGRLDADSEGLLLLTNDGELTHRVTHPSFEIPKTYIIDVPGPIGPAVMRRLRRGVDLEDGRARADDVRIIQAAGSRVLLEITLHEGRKHIVRRMMDEVGHPVSQLVRTQLGPVQLGNLKPGRVRHLTRHEVSALYGLVGL
jgi:23S rRNA pseudouridine2605 synthase